MGRPARRCKAPAVSSCDKVCVGRILDFRRFKDRPEQHSKLAPMYGTAINAWFVLYSVLQSSQKSTSTPTSGIDILHSKNGSIAKHKLHSWEGTPALDLRTNATWRTYGILKSISQSCGIAPNAKWLARSPRREQLDEVPVLTNPRSWGCTPCCNLKVARSGALVYPQLCNSPPCGHVRICDVPGRQELLLALCHCFAGLLIDHNGISASKNFAVLIWHLKVPKLWLPFRFWNLRDHLPNAFSQCAWGLNTTSFQFFQSLHDLTNEIFCKTFIQQSRYTIWSWTLVRGNSKQDVRHLHSCDAPLAIEQTTGPSMQRLFALSRVSMVTSLPEPGAGLQRCKNLTQVVLVQLLAFIPDLRDRF